MGQSIKLPGIGGGTGITVVLFLMGVYLVRSGIDADLGKGVINIALIIAAIYGILGIFGILMRMGLFK